MRKFWFGLSLGLLSPIFMLALTARLGLLSVNATAQPSAWETTLAHTAMRASVARSASGVANPTAANDVELLAGMRLYRNNCSGCHGDSSGPSPWGSTSFYPRVPQFAQSPPQKPDWQMFWILRHGIRYSGMGAWAERMLPDKEAWEVVTFLSRLNSLPPAVDQAWHSQR